MSGLIGSEIVILRLNIFDFKGKGGGYSVERSVLYRKH